MSGGSTDQLILAIDQGTTNSKAALISADGQVVSGGSAAVGISSPRPGWVQQDPERIWSSVLEATAGCLASAPDAEIAGVALSTQRESVVGWQASTGAPLGPVIGWQDRRTADWCNQTINDQDRQLVRARTGLPVDPMFSAPKMRWLLDHLPNGVSVGDVRVGTVDSWLIWRLTGGAEHLCEAGNASRTLLYDITGLDWSHDLLEIFGLPATAMPAVMASDQGFGMTSGVPLVPDKTPILAVLADSHAALYGHGCTDVGSAKATYGTGSSVMAPVAELSTSEARVPTTLAWVIDKSPTYALEGNILSSGATLAWAADLLTDGRVADLVALAETVPDSGGATLVPAFSGLGAPHWDREAHALISGMSPSTTRAHIARAAVDSIAHQICDIVDVIQERSVPLRLFRADGGATSSALVVQTQADLLGREVQVGEVAEVSALGAAKLAWRGLGNGAAWPTDSSGRIYRPILDPTERGRRRQHWAGEINRTRLTPSGKAASMPKETAEQWREVDIAFDGPAAANPYTDVEAWVIFTHSSGEQLRRPVFWDGGSSYRVRFASTQPEGEWEWSVYTPEPDHEFRPAHGTLSAGPPVQDHPHRALTRGFVTAHSSGRSFCYADGSPAFWVIDTAWAMPFRATVEDVVVYAADRQSKGFNAVLLMSVQPDMNARGPVGRNVDEGFEIGFHDLSEGRLTKINVEYFQYLDKIIDVLTNHGITPVLQPVFHGFGWKGLDVAGPVVPPADYARYCRYLVARFGARPAIYLPCGDGAGTEPQVEAGGREIHAWDAYGQATGIHYRPHHRNDEHQDADWLDFQSCQTGHMGDHVPDRLATMWAQRPAKAIMNGEPSYEHSGRRGVAEGWWQGHDAWSNLCAGALMGVAYGAASLWPWRLHPDEPGHGTYFLAEGAGWKEALDFAGSRYVGLVGKIIDDLPITRASPCWDVSANTRGLLDPGVLYLGYAEHGGPWMFFDADGRVPSKYWLIDPRTGRVLKSGDRPPNYVPIEFDRYEPSILICAETTPAWVQQQEDAARR